MTIKVIGKVIYAPTGKRTVPLDVIIECDETKRSIYDGCTLKEVKQDSWFIDRTGDNSPVKNEKGNRGVSISRFVTEKKGQKPKDGNPLNVSLSNWI